MSQATAGRPTAGHVQKQIVLPWSKAVEIAYRSIRVRFWRSVITMAGVVLAVAFMMSILATESIVAHLISLGDDQINFLLEGEGIDPRAGLAQGAGVSQQQIWLISLSLLVALIGIVNSMLMSVTERFREIGTMKCLGALDKFIIRLFLLESTFQGMIGTIFGIVIGLGVAVVWKCSRYGGVAVADMELWLSIGKWIVGCFLVGTVISVVAAIYPARTAARMAPVDAMRADE